MYLTGCGNFCTMKKMIGNSNAGIFLDMLISEDIAKEMLDAVAVKENDWDLVKEYEERKMEIMNGEQFLEDEFEEVSDDEYIPPPSDKAKIENSEARGRGRPKGVLSEKRHELLLMIMETGCPHPLEGLACVARDAYAQKDMDLAVQCFKELAQYVAPKLKAVEHLVDVQETQQLVIVIPEDEDEDED